MHAFYTAIAVAVTTLLLWGMPVQSQRLEADKSVPAAQGLVGWWKALPGYTGGKHLYDLLGQTSMLLVGQAGWVTANQPWMPQVLRFDGSSAYLELPAQARYEPPSRTVLLWLRLTADAPDYGTLVADTDTTDHLLVFTRTGNRFAVYMGTTTGTYAADPITAYVEGMVVGQWSHIAVTYSASLGELRFYKDCGTTTPGVITAGGSLVPSGLPTTFGALRDLAGAPGNFLTADMDDIRIYNRALTQSEVCGVMRESTRGEPMLLRSPLLALGLAPLAAGAKGNFLPFFQP